MIAVDCVTRRFGNVVAVRDVSFQLRRDEIVGFVGPNGAGKSTLLKMLATYLYPSSGRLAIDGIDVVERPLDARRRIGYLAGDTPLYHEMRADRFLAFLGQAHGYSGAALGERLRWVTEACGLADALPKRIKECSTGYRKRIGLAGALIHDPEVIILDEPTHGLDPLQVLAFRELLRRLRPGRTILLSSHIIAEVAQIADRLLLIHEGVLLADGPLADLCAREGLPPTDVEGLFVRLVRRHEERARSGGSGGGPAATGMAPPGAARGAAGEARDAG
jgi:ABC-2 type transport system ATP-binding protein